MLYILKNMRRILTPLTPLLLALFAFCVYAATLLPGVGGGDTAEFQRVAPTLGLAHSTGYPLYTLLGWAWTHLLPFGSAAWRMNVFSAAMAAATVAGSYGVMRLLGVRRVVAAGSALALALALTFWQQATHAEIYALAALLQVSLLVALLLWRMERVPLSAVGLVVGLMMLHHRTAVLLLPGAGLFVLFTRRPTWREIGLATLAIVAVLPLYGYVPLRVASWQNGWLVLREYVSGDVGREWLRPAQLWHDGWSRIAELGRILVVPQFTWVGVALALWGAVCLVRRDRATAALLLTSYVLVFAFCAAYYVDDLDAFLLPAHVIQVVLIGIGMDVLVVGGRWSVVGTLDTGRMSSRWQRLSAIVLLLPVFLAVRNLPVVRTGNTAAPEHIARERMAQPLVNGALVIGDGWSIESLRYLQAVEQKRLDLEFGFNADATYIRAALAHNRAVYLLQPAPALGLVQRREHGFWRVADQPLVAETTTNIDWQDGITLAAYTVPAGVYRAGDSVLLTLEWRATNQPQHDYVLFVHLVDANERIWGQTDISPNTGATSTWAAGSLDLDIAAPTFAPDTPPGTYTLRLGWYDAASGERSRRIDGTEWLELGRVVVE